MLKQTQSSGLLINQEDEVVTYILHHEDQSQKSMKYVINESTGWYAAATDLKPVGVILDLSYQLFLKHREFYLNDNKATNGRVFILTDDLLYNEAKKIKEFIPYLEQLKDQGNEAVLDLAKQVLDLHFTLDTKENSEMTCSNKRLRMRAKGFVKKLRIFIDLFE